jgi:hypothetical protein
LRSANRDVRFAPESRHSSTIFLNPTARNTIWSRKQSILISNGLVSEGHFEQTKAIIQDEITKWPHDRAVDLYDVVRRLGSEVSFTTLFGERDIDRIQTFGDLIVSYHRGNWNWLAYLFPMNVKGTPYHSVLQTAQMLKAYIRDWIAESYARSPTRISWRRSRTWADGEGNPPTAERILAYMVFYGFASYERCPAGGHGRCFSCCTLTSWLTCSTRFWRRRHSMTPIMPPYRR